MYQRKDCTDLDEDVKTQVKSKCSFNNEETGDLFDNELNSYEVDVVESLSMFIVL